MEGKTLEQLFAKLRPDIQRYFQEAGMRPEDGCYKIQSTDHTIWRIYELHKARISHLCGFDAKPQDYDPQQYKLAIKYLVDFLGI